MKKFFSILLLAALFGACSTEKIEQEKVSPQNSVSISNIKLPPVGGVVKFTITSDNNWSINTLDVPSTISIDPYNGRPGTTEVTVSALQAIENIYFQISIKSGNVTLAEIPVTQDKPYLDVSVKVGGQHVDPNDVPLIWNSDTYSEIVVNSNTDWKIKGEFITDIEGANSGKIFDKWMWFSADAGLTSESSNGKTIKFIPLNYNLDSQDRVLSFDIENAAESVQFQMKQDHKRLTAEIMDGNDFSFAPCNPTPLNVLINSEFDSWTVTKCPDWLDIDSSSGYEGESSMTLTSKVNAKTEVVKDTMIITGSIYENGSTNKGERKIQVVHRPYVFNLSNDYQEVDAYETTKNYTIDINSSGKWSISGVPSWAEVNPQKGYGIEYGYLDEFFTVRAKSVNYDMHNSRQDIIYIKSEEGNDLIEELSIVQEKYKFDAQPESDYIGTIDTLFKKLNVDCSGDWQLESSSNWLIFDKMRGTGSQEIKYRAGSVNEADDDRTAKVTLKSITHENNNKIYTPLTFDLTQQKFLFKITPNSKQKNFKAIENDPYQIQLTSSVPWNAKQSENWIKVSPASGNTSSDIAITVDDNYDLSAREASVTLRNEYNNTKHVISISQDAFKFDTDGETVNFTALNPGSKSITLYDCTGEWSVTGTTSWMTVTPTTGEGSATITIRPDEYHSTTSATDREARLLLRSKYYSSNNKLQKEIIVKQEVFVFGVSVNMVNVTQAQEQKVSVYCSGSWSATTSATWLTITPASGSGNKELVIKANSKNDSKSARTATITVQSNAKTETITVTQAAGV